MPPKLEADDLAYRTADGPVLRGVSLSVDAGETVAVVGPSGAGKSTFLRLLVRLDEPTGGTVRYEGADYRSIDPQTLRERVGLVPQGSTLVAGTVRENVTLGPRLRGEPYDDGEVDRLLERVGLPEKADRAAETLSGGEAQRVALARTLLNDPDVLLLDEPTASLDAATERTIEAFLDEERADRGLTCVLVTHDDEQARRLASRAFVFDDGRVAETVRTAHLVGGDAE